MFLKSRENSILRNLFLLGTLSTCASNPKQPQDSSKEVHASKRISANQPKISSPTRQPRAITSSTPPVMTTIAHKSNENFKTPAPKQTMRSEEKSIQECRSIFRSVFIYYQKLARIKTQRDNWAETLPTPNQILSANESDCDNDESALKFLAMMQSLLNQHSGKFGALLPLKQARPQQIFKGMSATLKGSSSMERMIAYDSALRGSQFERILAEFIFTHRVAMIIGGYDNESANFLRTWSSHLMIPVLILGDGSGQPPGERTFYNYPTERLLARRILREAKSFGWSKLGLIYPNSDLNSNLISALQAESNEFGVHISRKENYFSANFESMDSMARRLFLLDQANRPEEYELAYMKAKAAAEKAKRPFYAKDVMLPPKIEFDALIVLDHHRMVRHLAKIFQFYGVRSLKMIGHSEWRALGIIDPFDPFFEGSFFVDIIGAYTHVSRQLEVADPVSDFFASTKTSIELDGRYIGMQVIESIRPILEAPQNPRRLLHNILVQSQKFDTQKQYKWPMEVFIVRNGKVALNPRANQ